MGFVFASVTVPYVLAAILMPCTFNKFMPKRMIFVVGLTIAIFGIGFASSLYFTEKDQYWHVIVGLCFLGFAQPLLIVPVLPEAMD